MTIELSATQILFLRERLQTAGLSYEPLQEELLDHICCMVETKMQQGLTFHHAGDEVFTAFGKDGMQELQKQTFQLLHQKTWTMKRISLLVLAFLLATVTCVWAFNQDPPSTTPLEGDYEITSDFGMRMHPIIKEKKMHLGVDFRAPVGTEVVATSNGIVVKAKYTKGYGNYVVIKHDESYETLYSQLSKINVSINQEIKKGEVIGLSGNSGSSTGPHLHYEVRKDGKAVNPADYLRP